MPASRQRSRSWSQDSGQEQVGIDQGLEAAAGDAEVDGDDAVLLLADLAAPLALHAGSLGALLDGAGLVDDADGAQLVVGELVEQLQRRARCRVSRAQRRIPDVVTEELLEGADGGAGGQGDGLGRSCAAGRRASRGSRPAAGGKWRDNRSSPRMAAGNRRRRAPVPGSVRVSWQPPVKAWRHCTNDNNIRPLGRRAVVLRKAISV